MLAAAEKHAIEESQRLRDEAHKLEHLIRPVKDREREELKRQLRETAGVDDQLREELHEAKGRLWRKEERAREAVGTPWASLPEVVQ